MPSPKSPSPVLDPFVKCLRDNMEITAEVRDKKHTYFKVPKAETSKFRDDILDHVRNNFGIMQASTMLDLIENNFSDFMKRQGRLKRMTITVGMKGLGSDPSTSKGREWWLSGMGCTNESEPVIAGYRVSFEPQGEYKLYFENFKDCLNEQLGDMKGSKKKGRRTKKKKGSKGKKGKSKGKGKGKGKGKKTRRRTRRYK